MKAMETSLEVLIKSKDISLILVAAGHDTGLLVVRDTLLKEVSLTRKRNVLHKVEGVGRVVDLGVAKREQQSIGDKLNVLAHQLGVHTEQRDGESIGQKDLLNFDGLSDDTLDDLLGGTVVKVREKQAGKVSVHTLVTRNKLVRESKTRHETALLQPEDGSKRAREEDTLNGSERDKTLTKGTLIVGNPSKGPVGLLLDAGNSLNSVKEEGGLLGVLDVSVNEQRVGLSMDVLHHNLKAVEALGLRNLDLTGKALNQILIDNTVRSSKESKNA